MTANDLLTMPAISGIISLAKSDSQYENKHYYNSVADNSNQYKVVVFLNYYKQTNKTKTTKNNPPYPRHKRNSLS